MRCSTLYLCSMYNCSVLYCTGTSRITLRYLLHVPCRGVFVANLHPMRANVLTCAIVTVTVASEMSASLGNPPFTSTLPAPPKPSSLPSRFSLSTPQRLVCAQDHPPSLAMARVAFLSTVAWTSALVSGHRSAAAVGRDAFVCRITWSPPPLLAVGGRSGAMRRNLVSASPAPRMGLVDDVTSQMKVAMKAKDADTLRVLRNMRAAFLTAQKETGSDTLDDAAAVACLKRLVKQRNQSIEMYEKGGRTDLAEVCWPGEGGGGGGSGGRVFAFAPDEAWAAGRLVETRRDGLPRPDWLMAPLRYLPVLTRPCSFSTLGISLSLFSFSALPHRSLKSLSWPLSRPISPPRRTKRPPGRGWKRRLQRWGRPSLGTWVR